MIIKRYLTKEILQTAAAVTLVLLLAFLCQQVVRYLNYAAIGKIPTNVLLELVSFEIPYLLALLLPLCLYLGILLGLGRLYADNEMAILQMCGFGRRPVLRLMVWLGLAISAVVFILMVWINPAISAKRERVMQSDKATVHLVQTMMPGRFQVSPDGKHVMYVEKLSADRNRALHVFLAQERKKPQEMDKTAWMLVMAKQGYQIKDKLSHDPFFVTTEGFRYEGTPGQNDYKIIQFRKYAVHIPPTPTHITHHHVETLPTLVLLQHSHNPRYVAEWQWRVSIALSVLLLALLAVPLSALRPRQGRYLLLVPATLVYVIYVQLLFIARRLVEQGSVSAYIGMWWVHGLILLLIAGVILFSNKKRKLQ